MKILVVEDDAVNRKLFGILLKDAGFETLEAVNGKQAISVAIENMPDLILMDIQMPELDGISANRILKTTGATAKIPVIALTAFAMKDDGERFISEKFDGYISKPVNVREFVNTIKSFAGE